MRDALLVSLYTSDFDRSPNEWLGGEHAYISQTQKVTKRLIRQIDEINKDTTFLGHVSDRFVRSSAWSVQNIQKYSEDPLKTRKRLNYHACAVTSVVGEILAGIDDVSILVTCEGKNIRSPDCKSRIQNSLSKLKGFDVYPKFPQVCLWSLPGE